MDPFAGLGTTLTVCEKLGRIPYGIEMDAKRCTYIRTKIKSKGNVICGNNLKLDQYKLPQFNFSITSPPYNCIYEENYLSGIGGYARFLKDIKIIYAKLKPFMKKNAYVVIEVANLKGKKFTPLAWDIARKVSTIFHFEGEIIVAWQGKGKEGSYGYGYDHSYCLVFKNL